MAKSSDVRNGLEELGTAASGQIYAPGSFVPLNFFLASSGVSVESFGKVTRERDSDAPRKKVLP
jgi:hypothetical protein